MSALYSEASFGTIEDGLAAPSAVAASTAPLKLYSLKPLSFSVPRSVTTPILSVDAEGAADGLGATDAATDGATDGAATDGAADGVGGRVAEPLQADATIASVAASRPSRVVRVIMNSSMRPVQPRTRRGRRDRPVRPGGVLWRIIPSARWLDKTRRGAAGHRPARPAEGLSAPSAAGRDGAVSTLDRNPSALPRRLARAEARIHRARQEVPTE